MLLLVCFEVFCGFDVCLCCFVWFFLCVYACVYVHKEAAFSGIHILLLGSICTPFPNTNKFTDFSDEHIDLRSSPVWQYCALLAEKRTWVIS